MSRLRSTIFSETGIRFARSYLETILKNRFYLGYFVWQGIECRGSHDPIIPIALFNRVQASRAGAPRSAWPHDGGLSKT
ncbi:MAG: recombinase family protein [Candidatus Korobacteraceae bacterium]